MSTTITRRSASQPKQVTRELVAAWEQKRPALKALNDATIDKPRGYAIQVARAIELAGDKIEFAKVARYWKDSILWVRGITIEYDHASKSYRFPEVENHLTARYARQMKSAERRHRSEALKLSLIVDDDMQSDHQRKLRLLQRDQHNESAGKIESQREFVRIAMEKPETLPRLK